eukprot:TRINITY_DN37682_c0_g1_i1.p1 TRINITY_DN37682_c0_g1~~TRINITY_DN37682_c0_g1_i1.p1  ORF type:complete len:350 (-),score=65.81 TRINITY_DN37682_c0_g1_i1:447-1496(-)
MAEAKSSSSSKRTSIAILDQMAYIERSREKRLKRKPEGHFIHAMYSSLVDGIVTDPELMVVPLDDHALVRGHAVFDTATLRNGRVFRLKTHLDRLFLSAKSARISLPFGCSEEENRLKMTEVVCQTCVASGKKFGSVRFWLSAGPGNFAFTPDGCEPAFYCVLCGSDDAPGKNVKIIDEFLIDSVPTKPQLLAELKSNNYMLNCLTAMSSRDLGGLFGIQLKSDKTVGEGCVANCAMVTKDSCFVTPKFNSILAGTTVRKAMELSKKHLLEDGQNLLKSVVQRDINMQELWEAKEIMMLCGDTKVFVVRSLNGKEIADGKAGPVATALQILLVEDADSGDSEHIDLEYP